MLLACPHYRDNDLIAPSFNNQDGDESARSCRNYDLGLRAGPMRAMFASRKQAFIDRLG